MGGGGLDESVDVQARVSVASECVCVCCTHLFSFFPLAFILVNDLSLVSRCCFFVLFWKCARLFFVAVCFFLLYALVFYFYCRVIPDVLSLMFFHVPPLGFLK